MTIQLAAETACQTPSGLNHVVLNVRDIEAAHQFWTECLGFRRVGTLRRPDANGKPRPRMYFYSGESDGKLRHHDIALVEHAALPAGQGGHKQALNHVAIAYPTLEAWQNQIAFLMDRGLRLYGRVDRGVTFSIHVADPDGNEIELVHERPRAQWEGDIDAALNQAVARPIGA